MAGTYRVGGLRADITARDVGFQAASRRTVRSLRGLQTTAARVQQSFNAQNNAARRVAGSYNRLAAAQGRLTRTTTLMNVSLTSVSTSLRRTAVSLINYIRNLDLTRVSTIALNLATAIMSGNFVRAGQAALAAFGPQAALAAAAIGTSAAAMRRFGSVANETNRHLGRMARVGERVNTVFARLTSAAVFAGLAVAAGRMVTAFTGTVDSITNLVNRINLVSAAGTDASDVLERLRDVAEDTRTSLASTGELYTRLAEALQGTLPTEQLLQITDTIQRTVVLSGVSAQSAEAALTQLAQGFASGVLRGEELNSVLEQLPRLTRVFTDELGVGIGELRDLAKEGELTTQVLGEAILAQSSQVQTEFVTQATTVDQALTVAADKFDQLLVAANDALGVTNAIIAIVNGAGVVFEGIAGVFEAVARTWEVIGNILDNLEARGFFNTVTSGQIFEGAALEVSGLREDLADAIRLAEQRRTAEEAIVQELAKQRTEYDRLVRVRSSIERIGFDTQGFGDIEREFNNAATAIQYLEGQLATASAATQDAEANVEALTGSIEKFVQSVDISSESTEALAEEVEKLNSDRTISELEDQLTDEEWYKYATAVQTANDAINRFYENQKRQVQDANENAENFNIEQLDARLTDEQFLERQNFLLANQIDFAEEVTEATRETVSEYDRWIQRMEELHNEAQSIQDLNLASTAEDIAGRVVFNAIEIVEPAVLSIEQLDEALTDNEWLEYADAVAAATSAVQDFRNEADKTEDAVGDRSGFTIAQLDEALSDEDFLARQAALLRDNVAVLEFFRGEVQETVSEYEQWIERMQEVHAELETARELATAETGEQIAGSIEFVAQAVQETAQSIEALDDSLTDNQWNEYLAAADRAREAVAAFYEERRKGEEEAVGDRSGFSISQLDEAISDESFLARQKQLLEDNADIAAFFTDEVVETVQGYDRWIDRMERLHEEAQAIAQINIGDVGERIAGSITFDAQSTVNPAVVAIDALDEALTDNQWIQYSEAVDEATRAVTEFRDANIRALSSQANAALGIDQLDAALTDEQFLERQQQLLEDNAQIASFFADETSRTVETYDLWIRRMQQLHEEAQQLVDLGVASAGEDIAGSIRFVEESVSELAGGIGDLDAALTDDEWGRYNERVQAATESVEEFYRTRADAPSAAGGLNIEQLDALLTNERFLERQRQLLSDNADIAAYFNVETKDTVNEYDRWIDRMQRLHSEAQSVVDLALGDTGERIAGSMSFVAESVEDVALSIGELDEALTDDQWVRYANAVREAQAAIDEFYESRQVQATSARNPEQLTIDQLDTALTDEQFLERANFLLANQVEFSQEITEKTRETVSEYDRWIERMRSLNEEAQSLRDLAVAETGEQLAGAIVFNAESRISADRRSIEELDDALTDEQWVRYQQAVDDAADSIEQFRDTYAEAIEDTNSTTAQFAQSLNSQLSSSFANAIAGVQSFNDAFEQTAAFIIRRLIEMTLEATLFENTLSGGAGGGGGIGGFFDSILNFFSGRRQAGGPVGGGRAYLVGEAGPELFVPNASGNIVPNGAFGGSGQMNLTIQVNGVQDPTIVRNEILNALPVITGEVKNQITSDSIRPSQTRRSLRVAVS